MKKLALLAGVNALVLSVALTIPGAAAASEGLRLAIKGYDPVAYFTMSRPVEGKPQFEHAFDEVRYRFATSEHRDMFRADPDRYAPRFRGLCAMGLGAKGFKVEANPENWVIHEGRLYLTQSSFGPRAFRKDPGRWDASAEAHLRHLESLPAGSGISWW